MDRRQLLKRLDAAWLDFQESYAGLSELELMEPGVTGAWSVRDILAHVTTWEEEALKHLPSILNGEKPPRYSAMYGGIAAFNAQMTEKRKNLSLSQVQRRLNDTHGRLVEFIENAPEVNFGTRRSSDIAYGSTPTAITRSTPRQYANGVSAGQRNESTSALYVAS